MVSSWLFKEINGGNCVGKLGNRPVVQLDVAVVAPTGSGGGTGLGGTEVGGTVVGGTVVGGTVDETASGSPKITCKIPPDSVAKLIGTEESIGIVAMDSIIYLVDGNESRFTLLTSSGRVREISICGSVCKRHDNT